MKRTLVALAFISLASPAFAAMSKAELDDEFIGKRLKWEQGQTSGTVRYSKNGKASLRIKGGGIKSDKGTWRFRGNRLCVTWEKIRDGKEGCFTVTRTGARSYRNSNGSIITR